MQATSPFGLTFGKTVEMQGYALFPTDSAYDPKLQISDLLTAAQAEGNQPSLMASHPTTRSQIRVSTMGGLDSDWGMGADDRGTD